MSAIDMVRSQRLIEGTPSQAGFVIQAYETQKEAREEVDRIRRRVGQEREWGRGNHLLILRDEKSGSWWVEAEWTMGEEGEEEWALKVDRECGDVVVEEEGN